MDALELIAQARERQETAERECEHWKKRSDHARQRLKLIIDLVKRRPIEPPTLHEKSLANWKQLEAIVNQFADVLSDPYARYPDDEDDFSMNHETVKTLMVHRLQDLIKAAADKAAGGN